MTAANCTPLLGAESASCGKPTSSGQSPSNTMFRFPGEHLPGN